MATATTTTLVEAPSARMTTLAIAIVIALIMRAGAGGVVARFGKRLLRSVIVPVVILIALAPVSCELSATGVFLTISCVKAIIVEKVIATEAWEEGSVYLRSRGILCKLKCGTMQGSFQIFVNGPVKKRGEAWAPFSEILLNSVCLNSH